MLYIILLLILFIFIPNILILSNIVRIENFYFVRYKLIGVSEKLAGQDGAREKYYTYRIRTMLLPYVSDTITLSQSMVNEVGIGNAQYNNWYSLVEWQRKALGEELEIVRSTILN